MGPNHATKKRLDFVIHKDEKDLYREFILHSIFLEGYNRNQYQGEEKELVVYSIPFEFWALYVHQLLQNHHFKQINIMKIKA